MLEKRLLDDIDYIVGEGRPQRLQDLDVEAYRSAVPEALIEIWKKTGVASWADGAFVTCDPQIYVPALGEALEGNPHLSSAELTPFILTAFGTIKAWHARYGVVDVDFPRARAIVSRGPNKPQGSDEINLLARIPIDRQSVDPFGLLDAARTDLGRLEMDEIYGFAPALVFGGPPILKNLSRLRADVHLSILAQTAAPFEALYIDGTYGRDAHFVPLGE